MKNSNRISKKTEAIVDPILSFIVTSRCGAKKTEKCIKSILRQSERRIEIIFIYDEAMKNLRHLAEKDKRIIAIRDSQGASVAEYRNAAIMRARGDYIIFSDGTNIFSAEAAEKMIHYLYESQADCVLCASNDTDDPIAPGVRKTDAEMVYYAATAPISGILFRKETLVWRNIRFSEDIEWPDFAFCLNFFLVCDNVFYHNESFLSDNGILLSLSDEELMMSAIDSYYSVKRNGFLNQKSEIFKALFDRIRVATKKNARARKIARTFVDLL